MDDYRKIHDLLPQVRHYLDLHQSNAVTKVEKFRLGPGGKAIEARFVTKQGVRIPILFSRTAISDDNGEISDIICIAKDMSGYVRVEEPVVEG